MFALRKYLALAALITAFTTGAAAHTWVEEYQVISDNGTYTGAVGYTRGYVPRSDPTFNGFSMLWLLPDSTARNNDSTTRTHINSTDFVCPPQQRTSNYTATFPKLQVSPGDYVAMKYLENGHTTLPWNITGKPAAGGTVFVFGSTQPSDTEKIADVMEWNTAGDGGNKRGFLLTAQKFDDGRCHQVNCGSISQQRQMLTPNHAAGQNTSSVESWCESDVKIPESAATGTLAIYWIWQWPTAPNVDCNAPAGKDEYYTSCADFDVVPAGSPKNVAAAVASGAQAANPQSAAVSDWKSRTAHTTSPSVNLMNNDKVARSVAAVQTAFASACSVQGSIVSANSLGVWPQVYVPNTCSVVTAFGTAAASAADAEFKQAASSYSAGSKSAWEAAFSNAGVPIQTPVPWSAAFSTGSAAPAATSASAYAPTETAMYSNSSTASPTNASSLSSTGAASYASPSAPSSSAVSAPSPSSTKAAAQEMITNTTTVVVVVTSTLAPGVPIPTISSGVSAPMNGSNIPIPTISTVGRRHPRSF